MIRVLLARLPANSKSIQPRKSSRTTTSVPYHYHNHNSLKHSAIIVPASSPGPQGVTIPQRLLRLRPQTTAFTGLQSNAVHTPINALLPSHWPSQPSRRGVKITICKHGDHNSPPSRDRAYALQVTLQTTHHRFKSSRYFPMSCTARDVIDLVLLYTRTES